MNQRFFINELQISGLVLIQRKRLGDDRGYLERLFCAREMSEAGWHHPIAQINVTRTSRQGAVRGMHFQYPPRAEKKIVICIRGQVFDVAVDLRKGSPTYLKWHGEILSPEQSNAMLIPEGLAHGFQALAPDVEMLYFHSEFYAPEFEAGIRPNDPALNILWPLKISDMSDRDRSHPLIKETFERVII
jgi:dTDP-4-dehydrorhamnose 3,5-epimerase